MTDDKINIQADPTVPNTSGSWVTVSWNGVDSPNAGDWIGVYEPAQANYSATAPVKYQVSCDGIVYEIPVCLSTNSYSEAWVHRIVLVYMHTISWPD